MQNLAKAAWGIPLSRRLLIRIPCYDEQVIKQVQYTLKRSLFCTSLPLVVSTWYAQALTVLPDSADSVAAATRPMTRPNTPLRVARLLSANHVALQAQQHIVHRADKPVLKYTTLPDPHAWKPMGQAMLENQRHCACTYLQRQHALLQNNVGHLVPRHPWQWGLVISKLPAYLMGSNARSKVLHCPTSLEPAMQRLQSCLQKKLTPQCATRPSDTSSDDAPLMQPEQAIDTMQELSALVTAEARRRAREAPHLQAEVARQAQLEMRCLQIATGQFDKKLTRLWGACSTLHEARILRDSLLGDRFLCVGLGRLAGYG